MSMQNMVFFQENAKLVEKTKKKPGPFLIFLCVPGPLHTTRIIFQSPFHFLMIEMGSVGGSSSQNM